ncbi:ATP-binding protein [Deltaproteobacteria bacterium TL4]
MDYDPEILNTIRSLRIFNHFPESTLKQLSILSTLTDYPPNTVILKKGERNTRVYFLMRGKVGIYSEGEYILGLQRRGDIFGEMSIISERPCSASVVSESDVTILAIRVKDTDQYTDIESDLLNYTLFRGFAVILTEKLNITTEIAQKSEVTIDFLEKSKGELQVTNEKLLSEINERKLAEKALQRERNLFVFGPVIVFRWLTKKNWPIEYVSPNVTQLGYSIEDFTSDKFSFSSIIHPEDRTLFSNKLQEYTETGKDAFGLDYRILCPDGSTRWVYGFTRIEQRKGNKISHCDGYLLDITARKETEEQLKSTQMLLSQSAKLASLGKLATGIAHEINQPLSYIKTTIQSIHEDFELEDINPKDALEMLKNADRQIERISDIIQHLRVFGREDPHYFTKVDLKQTLDNVMLLIGQRMKLKNIEFIRHIEEPLPLVRGNENQLEQVFINLLQNAMDELFEHKKAGKITVLIKPIPEKKQVQIQVSDDGLGISKKHLNNIFDPFFTTKPVGMGTGLGLSIVYSIIQLHGGKITCQSVENQGTTFFITLVIAETSHGKR